MGRRRTYMNSQTRRALAKLDPSGCITFVLLGLAFLIMGIIFLCRGYGSVAMPIIGIVLGIIFIIVGVILGVKYYHVGKNDDDDSDYTLF